MERRKQYPSDVSREQFERVRPLLEQVRKRTKPRTVDLYEVFNAVLYLLKSGAFPSEDAALKVMYLALRNLARKWNAVQGWKEALNRITLVWEARFPRQCA